MPQCSIIIPTYNGATLTRQCLDTLFIHSGEQSVSEVIVVDDGSTDMTQQLLASYAGRIRVVTHIANTGFAQACNDGAALATGTDLIFLNNDTLPTAGWLVELLSYAQDHPEAAIVGCKLLFPNNTIQHAGVVIGHDRNPRHLYAGFPADHPAVNKSRRFQIVTAACMLIRRSVFEALGGFDSTYRNGHEDVDLCLRARTSNYQVHYCHTSTLYHLESVSEGRFAHAKANARYYRDRWAEHVQPDEMNYYLEDGLLAVTHSATYPLRFAISPLLALIDEQERVRQSDQLLHAQSRQLFHLLKEVLRLSVELLAVQCPDQNSIHSQLRRWIDALPGEMRPHDDPRPQSIISANGQQTDMVETSNDPAADEAQRLRALLLDAHQQLLQRDDALQSAIYELQTQLAASYPPHADDHQREAAVPRFVVSKHLHYRQVIHQIREVVHQVVSPGSIVAVISKGDDELLALDGRAAWHFPQAADGAYAGYYPVNSAEAISHLEALRTKGGAYLLFPSTAFWWFEHYAGFKQYLDRHYQEIAPRPDTCIVFDLNASPLSPSQSIGRDVLNRQRQQNQQIRQVVRSILPQNAAVIVAIDGDDDLLDLDGRATQSMLDPGNGIAAVTYPGSSTELISRIAALYEQGARYILIPSTMFWWLEYYSAFAQYLERQHRTVMQQKHLCAIFELVKPCVIDNAPPQETGESNLLLIRDI